METANLKTPFQLREGLHKREIIRLSPDEVPIIDFGRIYGGNKAANKNSSRIFLLAV